MNEEGKYLVQIDSASKKKRTTHLHYPGRVPGNVGAFPFLLDDKECNLHAMFLLALFATYPPVPLSLAKTMTHFYHPEYAGDLEIPLAWVEDTGNSKHGHDALGQGVIRGYSYCLRRSPMNHFLNDDHSTAGPLEYREHACSRPRLRKGLQSTEDRRLVAASVTATASAYFHAAAPP